MAFSRFDSPEEGQIMSEINMTPLVDVMLVLLIVFIITVPVLNHAVQVALPQASAQPEPARPDTIQLGVDAAGALFWNDQPLPVAELGPRLQETATRKPQPLVQLRADKAVRYEVVAQTLAAAQRAGIEKIGFATDPRP